MSDWLKSLLREVAQKLVGIAVVWLAAHGLPVPQAVTDWTILALVTAGLVLWTAIVRFLETRYGTSAFAGFLRKVAQFLMLGIQAKPTYVPAGAQVTVHTDGATARTVVR